MAMKSEKYLSEYCVLASDKYLRMVQSICLPHNVIYVFIAIVVGLI